MFQSRLISIPSGLAPSDVSSVLSFFLIGKLWGNGGFVTVNIIDKFKKGGSEKLDEIKTDRTYKLTNLQTDRLTASLRIQIEKILCDCGDDLRENWSF